MVILEEKPYKLQNAAVCIGKFDGLHSGHRLLIDSIRACSGLKKVLFTFSFENVSSIYSPEEKKMLAGQLGMDIYIDCPFGKELSHMSPEDFLKDILVDECSAKVISVGEDFRFGYKRRGDVELLKKYSESYGYKLNVFPKKKMFGEEVSSTAIRKELKEGAVERVNAFLGQPYFIYGRVCRGNHLGGTINMPTANLMPPADKILPPFGVYASRVYVEGKAYTGVTNIGTKPTVPGENPVGVETFIMDFDSDIYGKKICVELYAFLRAERKFPDMEALRAQMEEDKKCACRYFHRECGK